MIPVGSQLVASLVCVCVCFVVSSDADWQSSKAVLVEASSRGETSRLIAADIQTLIIAGESPRRSLGYLYHVGGGDWMGLTTHIRYTHVDTERERKTSPDSKITSWTLMDTQRPPQFKDTSAQQRSNRRSKTKRARCIFSDNAAGKSRNFFLSKWQKFCFY